MKGKTLLVAIALVAVIGGGSLLYGALKDKVQTVPPAWPASEEESPPPEEQADERIKAPDFTVIDAQEKEVKLSDMLGKPVVLNFWASWCPPCKSEMPEFDKVFEELGGEVAFMMVDAVDGVQETQKKGAEYVAGQGYSFPVYYDTGQEAVMQYGIRAYPTTVFIDREGYVAAGIQGAIDEATLRKGIEMITGEE